MSWFQLVWTVVSAVVGGFIGGWTVAYRLGRWRQRVEDHLAHIESRLSKGDRAVDNVPVIGTRVDLVLEELRLIKAEMRQDRQQFVSHEECDRRHQDVYA